MGLIGAGSSRDNEPRGVVNVGNSVVLTEGLAAVVSDVGLVGGLGGGEISFSNTRGAGVLFSTGWSVSGGAVIERLGAVLPVMTGETL